MQIDRPYLEQTLASLVRINSVNPKFSGGSTDESAIAAHLEGILRALGMDVDAWETTYVQVLTGDDAVLEWLKGTTLRPVLALLDDSEQAEFLGELAERLRHDYPPSKGTTLFPFRRIFVVAHQHPHDSVLTSRG